MAIGAFHFWLLSRNPRGVPQYEYLVAIFIPVWSGLAYTAMAVGQGKMGVSGQIAHHTRYIKCIKTQVPSYSAYCPFSLRLGLASSTCTDYAISTALIIHKAVQIDLLQVRLSFLFFDSWTSPRMI
jgi:hypothetical protein